MTHCKVLFLASSPLDCNPLELDEEARAIEQRILQTDHRDAIDFVPKFAVRRDDLQLHLNKEKPKVLHFSGHGTKDEIEFKGDNGIAAPISKAGLKAMLKAVKDNIRLVVLNACYTRQQADSITDVIDCAIGMKQGIGDEAARVFAASFYLAIGFGRSVQNAFDQAVASLQVMGIPEDKTPILVCREGVDPAYVFLVDDSENLDQTDRKSITAIEFTLDHLITEFNESKFKAAIQNVTGIDAKLIRIASIRAGSTIVRVEGAPELLTRVLNQFRESQETLHRFAQLTNLKLMRWSIDGINYELAVSTIKPATQILSNTQMQAPRDPLVFISYSHDSDDHRARVLGISESLRTDGIETILDRYVEKGSPPEGWPRWMLNGLAKATHILCVCTETYYRRFRGQEVPGKGNGVDWEGALMTQSLYDARSVSNKFIPVLFERNDEAYIPEPLRAQTFYVLESNASYQALYDALLDQSGVTPGQVGILKRKPRATGQPLAFGGGPVASTTPAPVVTSSAARIWREKLDYLLVQEAVTVDPDMKFRLKHLIDEARGKIQDLEGGPNE